MGPSGEGICVAGLVTRRILPTGWSVVQRLHGTILVLATAVRRSQRIPVRLPMPICSVELLDIRIMFVRVTRDTITVQAVG